MSGMTALSSALPTIAGDGGAATFPQFYGMDAGQAALTAFGLPSGMVDCRPYSPAFASSGASLSSISDGTVDSEEPASSFSLRSSDRFLSTQREAMMATS